MTRPFARVRTPDAFPGHCLRCPRNEDLIDLGAEALPNYGVAYLCTVCFFEMVTAAGLIEQATYDATVAEFTLQIQGLETQLRRAIEHQPADGINPTPHEVEHLDGIRDLLDRLARSGRPGGGRDAVAAPAGEGAALAGADGTRGGQGVVALGVRVGEGLPVLSVDGGARDGVAGDGAVADGVDLGARLVRQGVDPFDFLEPGADDEAAGVHGNAPRE